MTLTPLQNYEHFYEMNSEVVVSYRIPILQYYYNTICALRQILG